MASTTSLEDGGAPLLSRERIIAKPGFNRWLVPPAALCIHLCIGMAYGFSVFWKPLQAALLGADGKPLPECSAGAVTFAEKSLGTLRALTATDCNWSQFDLGWMFTFFFLLLGISAATPGRKFFDQLLHLRWSQPESPQIWHAPAGHYLGGEPVFLGHPERDDRGCVLIQDFDAQQRASAFLLFDAFDIESGPLARLPLKHPIPPCFHAAWYPTASVVAALKIQGR